MSEGKFEYDMADFDRKFFEYAVKTAPAAAEQGGLEALSELKNDCDNVVPKTPLLEGNLRGDYSLILEGITQSKVVDVGSKSKGGSKPAERLGAKSIITKLLFRMPYAAKWHEAVNRKINWSEKGAGPKYLESKMMMFAKKYFGMIADRIRATTGK